MRSELPEAWHVNTRLTFLWGVGRWSDRVASAATCLRELYLPDFAGMCDLEDFPGFSTHLPDLSSIWQVSLIQRVLELLTLPWLCLKWWPWFCFSLSSTQSVGREGRNWGLCCTIISFLIQILWIKHRSREDQVRKPMYPSPGSLFAKCASFVVIPVSERKFTFISLHLKIALHLQRVLYHLQLILKNSKRCSCGTETTSIHESLWIRLELVSTAHVLVG